MSRHPARQIKVAIEDGEHTRVVLPGRVNKGTGEYLFYEHTLPVPHPSGDGSVRYLLRGRRIGIQRLENAVNTMLERMAPLNPALPSLGWSVELVVEDKFCEEMVFHTLVAILRRSRA
ncbi:MAG: hypothetical protein M0P69_21580 [Bacteroidales bacterium]|nr:hypothetical protein [Bacteroidales bacterium]